MAKKIRLISIIENRTKIDVVYKENGITKYTYITLDPGVEYELPNDPLFIASVKGSKFKKFYDRNMEMKLKSANIPYEVEMCKSCGGRVKKLVYNPLEVIE